MADEDLPTIAHVVHRLHRAGAEVLAADLSRKLASRYRFVFLCLDEIGPLGQQLLQEGFRVVDLRRRPGVDLRVGTRIARAVRRHGIDLLHAHQYAPFFYAAMGRRLGLGDDPPIVFTEHGRHYPDGRSAKRCLANRVLLKRTDRVTAVGGFVRDALVANEGIRPERHAIEVIYNGIDPQLHAGYVGHEARRAARDAMGVGATALVVLQVARFHPVKDHATAITAFKRVADNEPAARLVLVGDGPERGRIESLVGELGLAERVRFLGVREDVAALLPGAEVFMLSSLSEGISVTLLEAMAARLPIVATEVGGNPEVVEHRLTGLLSARGDADGLAQNLLLLLHDPALRKRMGDAGHRRLLARFTQEKMHAGYAKLYDELVAG